MMVTLALFLVVANLQSKPQWSCLLVVPPSCGPLWLFTRVGWYNPRNVAEVMPSLFGIRL